MKDIQELYLPEDVRYTQNHEWTKPDGDRVMVGISDYAQDQFGEIVFVDLPEVGDVFKKGEPFATVESVKAVSEIFMPLSGKIVETNPLLEETPEVVNEKPYTDGWMVKVEPENLGELDTLMTPKEYFDMLQAMASKE
jgi:glycine cleavage system H protein